ncbi:cell wall metabolism sensor histidine kinase WalK [Pullulanibacillus sp. KACC 23026]|uniref:cell wall metabolism sensor histidine kinase WalK n=1 Tax=Pullulanibacillus sp. KACC 23026 TaxID=3028315 RepID=UPI0023AECC13|nr:cell wall metabolism sensor histidine kinase WalK [Pullulanibacillus sp. KACC 23026]WEG12811.1 cell wall metabolism sensor histidine kinase WalK [Pullulanibacillus sp. KACC 23026]
MNKVGFFKSIQFKVVLIYTLLILLAMQLIGVYFTDRLEHNSLETFDKSMENQANLLSYNISEAIKEVNQKNTTDQKALINSIQDQLNEVRDMVDVQVIDNNGTILGTTSQDQSIVGKRTTNDQILADLMNSNGYKRQTLYNKDTKTRVMDATIPIKIGGDKQGLLFMEKSLDSVYDNLRGINQILATATGIALLVTAVLGWYLARTITRPLALMKRQALAVSQGDFSRRVMDYEDDEIGQLAQSFNNMTERLQEANATTEAERRKLRSILAFMTDGVVATDYYGHVILMNNRAEQLIRVYRQNALGESVLKILKIEDEYSLEDLYNMKESLILDFSTDFQQLMVRVNFSVVKNEGNNGLIAVLHDVTEQEQIEEERRDFVANVSHELRTPLTTMKSYLEALLDGALDDRALAEKFLGVAQTETDRMIRLVRDLLQLSKLDSRDESIKKERTNFITFFQAIIDRFEFSKTQSIEFIRKLPKRAVYVSIDPDKMTQVIDNVISNAIKYSPEGGSITFRVVTKGQHLVVSIKDEGVGIPEENVSRIFDRFYRVDRARSRKLGGTGLGLAIAKEIVNAHSGDIWAESEWTKGTTISFTLPLSRRGDGV